MIFGLGVDLVSIERIRAIWLRRNQSFAKRLMAQQEYECWCQSYQQFKTQQMICQKLAKYWAAKEASCKAMQLGFGEKLSWREISLYYQSSGSPYLKFSHKAAKFMDVNNIAFSHISFSDEGDMVLATVILETNER